MESEKRDIFSNHEKKNFSGVDSAEEGRHAYGMNVNGAGKSLLR